MENSRMVFFVVLSIKSLEGIHNIYNLGGRNEEKNRDLYA